ncbi:GNAT family N-acetyltransferase [Ramlibacter tataouinensis]|uniref:Acetyltransferase n=1 Tax=Ramlibacter tataouinensis TaxID=94132 RepID=A0A127JWQ6_9BURK|nr:GNAT family N-acetyltransferase [Ramlibacter tataouinensis]AMO24354.1 acetyltransferase [Ramlibacter tataouinensis]
MIRALDPSDDLVALTALIHAAYAPQAERGLRYWGTHQTVEDTRTRFAAGHGFVAELNGRFVGTITVRPPQPASPVQIYRDPGTWSIGQYAVHPELKGNGLGRQLHERAVKHARDHGAVTMALDTAQPAVSLIAMYRRWGYEVVGEADWRPHTNYSSVIMSKSILRGDVEDEL